MVLADKADDAGWLSDLVSTQGGWANIPPKSNRASPIRFSPWLCKRRNLIERFFNKLPSLWAFAQSEQTAAVGKNAVDRERRTWGRIAAWSVWGRLLSGRFQLAVQLKRTFVSIPPHGASSQ